jgi:hypothetical protein
MNARAQLPLSSGVLHIDDVVTHLKGLAMKKAG